MNSSKFWDKICPGILTAEARDEKTARRGFYKEILNLKYQHEMHVARERAKKIGIRFDSDRFFQNYNWNENRKFIIEESKNLEISQMIDLLMEVKSFSSREDAYNYMIVVGRAEQERQFQNIR